MKLQTCLLATLAVTAHVAATSVRQAPAAVADAAPVPVADAETPVVPVEPKVPTAHPNAVVHDAATPHTVPPMPTTTITETPNYEMTCGAHKHLKCEEHFNNASVDKGKKCCRFEGECGDSGLPLCGHTACCTDADGDSSDVQEMKEMACTCEGAVLWGYCYKTVQEALDQNGEEDTIYIGGTKTIEEPIYFSNRIITVAGVTCDGERAKIVANFDSKTEAAFEARRWDQKMLFRDLDITGVEGKSSSGIHGRGNEEDAGNQMVDLTLLNVHIYDMWCQRAGCGVFLGGAQHMYTDDDCVFRNLKLQSSDDNLYAGGAAIGVVYIPRGNEVMLRGTFKDNSASYEGGSVHSSGGAVYLDFVAGKAVLDGKFENNQANQGGAVNIQGNFGNTTLDGLYKSNVAVDGGFGARAGAVRVQALRSASFTHMKGDFMGNIAQGRGGVLATNTHQSNSQLLFDGNFHANVAAERGGVWNFWSAGSLYRGDAVLYETAKFTNNVAQGDQDDSSIFYISGDPSARADLPRNPSVKMAESEWDGTTTAVYGALTGVEVYTEEEVNSANRWFKLTEGVRYAGHLPSITFDEYVFGKREQVATQRYTEKVAALEERYNNKFEASLSKAEIEEARVLQRFENATARITQRFENADSTWQAKLEVKTTRINDRFDAAAAKAALRFEEASARANDRYNTKTATANERYALNDPTAENNRLSEAKAKVAARYEAALDRAELSRTEASARAEQRFATDMARIEESYNTNEQKVLDRFNTKSQAAKDRFATEEAAASTRANPALALSAAETTRDERIQAAEDKKTEDLAKISEVRQERINTAEAKRDTALVAIEEKYRAAEAAADTKRGEDLSRAQEKFDARQGVEEDKRDQAISEAAQRQADDLAAAEQKRDESLAAAEAKRDADFEALDTYDEDMAVAKSKFEDDMANAEQKKVDELEAAKAKNQARIDEAQAVKDLQQAKADLMRENIMAGKPSMDGVNLIVLEDIYGADNADDESADEEFDESAEEETEEENTDEDTEEETEENEEESE